MSFQKKPKNAESKLQRRSLIYQEVQLLRTDRAYAGAVNIGVAEILCMISKDVSTVV